MKKGGLGVDYALIKELIQKAAGTYGKVDVKLFDGIVESVDLESRTCVVNSVDHTLDDLTVRFMVDVSDGDMSLPQKDSTVTVAMTAFTDPYIVKATWLDEKLFIVGNQSFDIKPDKQIFNDGKYGGLATIKDPSSSDNGLLARLNKIEEDNKNLKTALQNLLTACSGMVTPSPGSPDPFSVAYAAQFATYPGQPLVKTTEVMISNPSITHGDKFK